MFEWAVVELMGGDAGFLLGVKGCVSGVLLEQWAVLFCHEYIPKGPKGLLSTRYVYGKSLAFSSSFLATWGIDCV